MSLWKDTALNVKRPESFLLKGALVTVSIMEIRSSDLALISQELKAKVQAAPHFFIGNPVVFNLEKIADETLRDAAFSLSELKALGQTFGLQCIGIKGCCDKLIKEAQKLGLADFSSQNPSTRKAAKTPTKSTGTIAPPHEVKIVARPVRSGQQVYAPGDLIVLSSVSAGAEVLAEGNIHIYGALRGKALAGAQGKESARVFCLKQEAELISIAGHFMNGEKLKQAYWQQPAQIYFDGNALKIEKLADEKS